MLIPSSRVKKNQAGDTRRQTRAQKSTPQSSGIDVSLECLGAAQAEESPERGLTTHLAALC